MYPSKQPSLTASGKSLSQSVNRIEERTRDITILCTNLVILEASVIMRRQRSQVTNKEVKDAEFSTGCQFPSVDLSGVFLYRWSCQNGKFKESVKRSKGHCLLL
ncbi:protein of unknown function [Methylocaldum szegediense]|uniref:Uncharacterized protein n=1 Tax=Methylocaldum szegediense TaxID=73780 RepID=A0ABN8WWI6_9GAMM|nr:protein of unknown function [Methylocaldum szegediense]